MKQNSGYSHYRAVEGGWYFQLPRHWANVKLGYRYFVDLGKMLDEKQQDGSNPVPYLRNQDVQWGSINSDDLPFIDISPAELSRYTVRRGDLLVCEGGDVGRAAIWLGDDEVVAYQKALHRLRPIGSDGEQPRYFFYVLAAAKQAGAFADSESKATISHLPAEKFRQYRFPRPPLSEQAEIADALDRETSRIDALIEKKTRFVELVREKRQAVVADAVTRGLDPLVTLSDSGIEWLGRIPSHWSVMALSRVTVSRCDGPFGSAIKSEHYSDFGVRVVRLQNIAEGEFCDEDSAFLNEVYCREVIGEGHQVLPGDIVIAGLGDQNNPLGRACVAPADLGPAIVKADCYRFRVDTAKVDPHFLAMQLSATARAECGYLSTGATRSRLNLGLAASRRIAIPETLEEQRAIVAAMWKMTAALDRQVHLALRSQALLHERRAALITAAVTGQVDVRDRRWATEHLESA